MDSEVTASGGIAGGILGAGRQHPGFPGIDIDGGFGQRMIGVAGYKE
jgi:hypothetical protein